MGLEMELGTAHPYPSPSYHAIPRASTICLWASWRSVAFRGFSFAQATWARFHAKAQTLRTTARPGTYNNHDTMYRLSYMG